jgi:hypothetical protein
MNIYIYVYVYIYAYIYIILFQIHFLLIFLFFKYNRYKILDSVSVAQFTINTLEHVYSDLRL